MFDLPLRQVFILVDTKDADYHTLIRSLDTDLKTVSALISDKEGQCKPSESVNLVQRRMKHSHPPLETYFTRYTSSPANMYTDPRQYDVAVGATAMEIGSVDGHSVYDGSHSIPRWKLQDICSTETKECMSLPFTRPRFGMIPETST